ncbi:MAG: hypothetical protein HGA85_00895 [Nanoarchaeota archaeon]|nr:hypothetical protein [Nanoarchaeota archaeon]
MDLNEKLRWYKSQYLSGFAHLEVIKADHPELEEDILDFEDCIAKVGNTLNPATVFSVSLGKLDILQKKISLSSIEDNEKASILANLKLAGKTLTKLSSAVNPDYVDSFRLSSLIYLASVELVTNMPGKIYGDLVDEYGKYLGHDIRLHFNDFQSDRPVKVCGYLFKSMFSMMLSTVAASVKGKGEIFVELIDSEDKILVKFSSHDDFLLPQEISYFLDLVGGNILAETDDEENLYSRILVLPRAQ